MIGSNLVRKLLGSRNTRLIKRMRLEVAKVNALEDGIRILSDEQLRGKTEEFKRRFAEGETLDGLLPEAFAVVREASVRVMGMRHFDVQLIGGMVLHQGNIAEMRTGEGKTLMATLPLYLNALSGKGVHLITVNDYLAERDCEWMKPIYEFLGLTTGVIIAGLNQEQRKAAYACDVVYGTNNEFGFDYLRDNMAFSLDLKVQRELNFSVVDEVDSILIDEARTPLIISGVAEDTSETYQAVNALVPQLVKQEKEDGPGDYSVDEKAKQVFLTEDGHQHIEELLHEAGLIQENKSLYDIANVSLMHHVNAGLRAHALFQRDVDYIVDDNEVVIIDEHTGRKMAGRRWSDGLHQAVEAKEGVKIQNESQTLASITFQNFFRIYNKLSGMTGTADTEAFEFQQIYGLEVVVIPTNKTMVRDDQTDLIYLNIKDKFKAIVEDITRSIEKGQPVLVGTASIEMSELLSSFLNNEKIKHRVLNAKFHEKEAHIIAQAGYPRAVTIATNMAGRGTDIVLGGNWKVELEDIENPTDEQAAKIKADWALRNEAVLAAGGLRIIGTERHESRRIDNQLRGRAGRQGDAGSSCFYLSIEDNLMRIYAGDRLASILKFVGMQEGDALESPLLTRTIEKAQRKVEGHNFDIRKQLLEYDDVANDQRKVIYQQRNELMHLDDISGEINHILDSVIDQVIGMHIPQESMSEQWDIVNLQKQLTNDFMINLDLKKLLEDDDQLTAPQIAELVHAEAKKLYAEKEETITASIMRPFEKSIMLQSLDSHWREHLQAMDHLRQGIHLRGYAQKNPKQEFKREAFELFKQMLDSIKQEVVSGLMMFQIQDPADIEALEKHRRLSAAHDIQLQHADFDIMNDVKPAEMPAELPATNADEAKTFVRPTAKVGRNDPCPCGSNKKYKQCHGQLQ